MLLADEGGWRMVRGLRSAGALAAAAGLALGLGLLISAGPVRVLVAMAGATVVALVVYRPLIGFLLVIASLPLDVSGTLGETALTNLSITKALAGLTVGAIVLEGLIRHRPLGLRRLLTTETLLTAGLLGSLIASTALHPTQQSVAEILRQMVILLFVLVIVYFVDRPGRLRQVAWVLVVTGTVVAAYSISQRIMRPVSISEEWIAQAGAVLDVGEESLGEMLRTTGTFSHPAWLGLFLSICIPFTLGLCWPCRRIGWRVAGMAAVVLQVLGILSTYSRMSYIGAALAVALFIHRRRLGIGLLMVMVAAAIVAFPAMPDDFRNRVYSILEYRQSSSSLSRLGQQLAGGYMFLDHPALGVGPGNFEDRVMGYERRVPAALEVQPIGAHNMYVETAAELGVPGLVLTLLVLVASARQLRRSRMVADRGGEKSQALLWEAAGIGLVVFAASALFVHAQYRKEWWLLVGLAAASRQFMVAAAREHRPEARTS